MRLVPLQDHLAPVRLALIFGFDSSNRLYQFRHLVPRLGRRARVLSVVPAGKTADVMLALSDARLEPKLLRVLSGPDPWVAIQAAVAKRGGLVVEAVVSTDRVQPSGCASLASS